MTDVLKSEKVLIDSIMSNLPAVPLVIDSVSNAVQIAKKYLTDVKRDYDTGDNIYLHSLRVALAVSKYAKETSPNDMFFKYEPVIMALLHDVIEDADSSELQDDLKTISAKVLKGVKLLTNVDTDLERIGKAKYMSLKFYNIFKEDQDVLVVKIFDRIDNVSTLDIIPMTEAALADPEKADLFIKRYLTETQNIVLNMTLSKAVLSDNVRSVYNKLLILLNDKAF